MNIAFVHQPIEPGVIPPSTSVAIWAHQASRRLAAENQVFAYARSERFTSRAQVHDGVHWRPIRVGPDRLLERILERATTTRDPNRPRVSSATHYLGYISQIALALRRIDAPIVQLFNFSQFAPVVRALNPRARIVLRMSCEWLTQFDRGIIAPRVDSVDLIVGCSDFITERIRRAFPTAADRCVTVHNGRDVEALAPPEAAPRRPDRVRRLLYVGRISPEKGVHVLLEALAIVVARFPNVRLEIIGGHAQLPYDYLVGLHGVPDRVQALSRFYRGDSPRAYSEMLEAQCHELKLDDHVEFTGGLAHEDLVGRYHRADVLVFPSVWDEPSGNPPIEAMAAGVPVVSTRTGGTAEYVSDGVTGLLAPPEDPAAVANAILRLLENDEQRASMGVAARRRAVELFSYETLAKELQGHYTRLARLPGRTSLR